LKGFRAPVLSWAMPMSRQFRLAIIASFNRLSISLALPHLPFRLHSLGFAFASLVFPQYQISIVLLVISTGRTHFNVIPTVDWYGTTWVLVNIISSYSSFITDGFIIRLLNNAFTAIILRHSSFSACPFDRVIHAIKLISRTQFWPNFISLPPMMLL
jgi:hypothetical protein